MSEDEPPPLEDMSEFLKQKAPETRSIELPTPKPPPGFINLQPPPPEPKPKPKASGLKKGFFNAQPKRKQEPVPVVKPKAPEKNPLVLDEVQQAMKYTTDNTSEWLTGDLMTRLAQHPFLATGLSNPRLMEAVDELRRDPKLAQTKYKDDHEVQAFFSEFSKVMADHFGRLSQSKEEEAAKKVEEDAELQELMQDPRVKKLLARMQKGQQIDFRELVYRDQELAFKFKKLIDKGLINVQT